MKQKIVVTVLVLGMLVACTTQKQAIPTVDPTQAALNATIAVKNGIATMVAQFTPTPTSTITPTPTATPEPTEVVIMASPSDANVTCRLGADKSFNAVETLSSGQSAEVVGKATTNGDWWKVRLASGNECWLLASLVTVSGDTSLVARVEPPPTATPLPAPTWEGTWTVMVSVPGNGESNPQITSMTLNRNGNAISTTVYTSWGTLSLAGEISASGTQAWLYGSAENSPNYPKIWVSMYIDAGNSNRFRGKVSSSANQIGAFCGQKNGAGFPSPCLP